jgi:hypothetical protein
MGHGGWKSSLDFLWAKTCITSSSTWWSCTSPTATAHVLLTKLGHVQQSQTDNRHNSLYKNNCRLPFSKSFWDLFLGPHVAHPQPRSDTRGALHFFPSLSLRFFCSPPQRLGWWPSQNSRVQPEGCATILTWPVAGPTWSNDRNRNITTSKIEFLVKMNENGRVLPPCLSASCLLTFLWKGSTLVSQMMAICGEFTIHIDDTWQTATCDNEQGSITFKWVTL